MSDEKTFRRSVYEVIRLSRGRNIKSRLFDLALLALVLVNTVLVVWETFPVSADFLTFTNAFQNVSCALFTIEYALRIWTADFAYPGLAPARARMRFIMSLEGAVDLLSVLPLYIPVFPRGFMALRALQLMRVFRVFRINKYSDALQIAFSVFRRKAAQLGSSCFFIFVLMLTASVVMYHLENPVQPDVFTSAFSAFWWAFNALTTTGYGDIAPVTAAGKVLGMLFSALGIALIAVPTGIITAGFIQQAEESREAEAAEDADPLKRLICPHCGRPYFDSEVDEDIHPYMMNGNRDDKNDPE